MKQEDGTALPSAVSREEFHVPRKAEGVPDARVERVVLEVDGRSLPASAPTTLPSGSPTGRILAGVRFVRVVRPESTAIVFRHMIPFGRALTFDEIVNAVETDAIHFRDGPPSSPKDLRQERPSRERIAYDVIRMLENGALRIE